MMVIAFESPMSVGFEWAFQGTVAHGCLHDIKKAPNTSQQEDPYRFRPVGGVAE